ncbi:MAG TPA: nuclear transport factor 2 family protein [Trebonia sp.]|jgi:hypothetical protein|nr:nuclear transport factor 2 family protein [Trebonia sp.]
MTQVNDIRARVQATFDQLGWAIDRRDGAVVTAALSATVTLDYTGLFGGEASTLSGQELSDQWRATLSALDGTQHVITGVRVTASPGGTVTATANVAGAHVRSANPEHSPWIIGGWYAAAFESAGDRLTISALTLHPVWQAGSKEILSAQ